MANHKFGPVTVFLHEGPLWYFIGMPLGAGRGRDFWGIWIGIQWDFYVVFAISWWGSIRYSYCRPMGLLIDYCVSLVGFLWGFCGMPRIFLCFFKTSSSVRDYCGIPFGFIWVPMVCFFYRVPSLFLFWCTCDSCGMPMSFQCVGVEPPIGFLWDPYRIRAGVLLVSSRILARCSRVAH